MGSDRTRTIAACLLGGLCVVLIGTPPCRVAFAEGGAAAPADAIAFVKQQYVHGVPYDEASHLPRSAVPTLIALLGDPANEPYFSNIVITLGVIGDSSATAALIDLMEGSSGEVSLARFEALLSVPTALGHLARQGDLRALRYLLDQSSTARWRGRGLRWRYGKYTGDKRNLLLTAVTVNGLAASGRMEALQRLTELRDRPESPEVGATIEDNVREGLAFNSRVRIEGAGRVFGAPQRGAAR